MEDNLGELDGVQRVTIWLGHFKHLYPKATDVFENEWIFWSLKQKILNQMQRQMVLAAA